MKLSIVGSPLPNIPWQEKPAGNSDLMWRYDGNPVIGRRPLPRVTGIYNSAVVPWQGGFIGVFRTGGMDRVPHLHVGRSPVPVARKHCFAPKHGTNSRDLFRGFAFRLAACANPATGRIALYYGAADTFSALCFCDAGEIVSFVKANPL